MAVAQKRKRKVNKGKKRAAEEFIIEEPVIEHVDANEDNAQDHITPASKGTTATHFIKFMNDLLDIMGLDENVEGRYLVMDNCTIHKSKPMTRKIESRGYRMMFFFPYSPELNPIEQF
ncbi:hypothetical protein G6F57_000909 [Rhizopus arrhizus]|nr:hypothetical protein G6F23_003960 [Rhizopus arrhizus]KAG1421445.1 hypothetical protein G6F58_003744 [Rhizopus delemar]KAG0761721.1 hypothetical protein G6F24_007347 [Rhizopus arrhizus]KAG0788204.1 hypothetical protein G6F21_007373 [Rhizopus arrhizus]KAG0798340.1 hypothetical protein G6F22_004322 [Rhizopus arrhizus]